MPKYSVCMPVLLRESSHKSTIEDTINSVKEFSQNYEFLICDDGSPLLTGFLKETADTYIRHNPKNKGIATSWNDLLRLARGDYLVVINDDIRVSRGWLKKLANVIKAGASVSAPINGWEKGMQPYHWFPGYCFMLRPQLLNTIGYFDERFDPANCEDLDYWYRVMKRGGTLGRAFDLKIYHKEGDVLHKMANYDDLSKIAVDKFVKKNGFNPQPYFFNGKDINKILKGGDS